MQIVIYDPVTPVPYSLTSAKFAPLGGTEATVVRIAEAINATVIQHNRQVDEGRYRSAEAEMDASHLIVLRESKQALEIARKFQNAKKYLWLHDLAAPQMDRGRKLARDGAALAEAGFTLICVSKFHAAQVGENFLHLPLADRPMVTHVYNPVIVSDAKLSPPVVDINKLVFFSSPHKGLQYATAVFATLYARNPALRLYIANPGYLKDEFRAQPGIINIGAVPHHDILKHVRSALCTFYPNYIYPETFGLALAESNALGTPVLTHSIGAAEEVLDGDGQFLKVPASRRYADSLYWRFPGLRSSGESLLGKLGAFDCYAERIQAWQRDGRPTVKGRADFELSEVISAWCNLLGVETVVADLG